MIRRNSFWGRFLFYAGLAAAFFVLMVIFSPGLLSTWQGFSETAEQLKKEKEFSAQCAIASDLLVRENNFLRQNMSMVGGKHDWLLARVIGSGGGLLRPMARIDRGRVNGLEAGLFVFVSPGRLFGQIEEVTEESALVRPLTHQDMRLMGQAQQSQITGLVQGRWGRGLVFSGIRSKVGPHVGEEVLVRDGHLPADWLVGRIESVQDLPEENRFVAQLQTDSSFLPNFLFILSP